MTTLKEAFRRGTVTPGPITYGSTSYPPDTRAAQCLVPATAGLYDINIIVVSDGTVLRNGSQNVDHFVPRP
jgi:hypothetical protein